MILSYSYYQNKLPPGWEKKRSPANVLVFIEKKHRYRLRELYERKRLSCSLPRPSNVRDEMLEHVAFPAPNLTLVSH